MLLAMAAALGVAQASRFSRGAALGVAQASRFSRSAVLPPRAVTRMATPLDAVAGPLNKWAQAAAAAGSPLDNLPREVKALLVIIPIVRVLGLLKSNGMLGTDAPTLGLGETREDLGPEAVPPSWSKAALARPCGHPPPQRLARLPTANLWPNGEPSPRGFPREAAVALWCLPRVGCTVPPASLPVPMPAKCLPCGDASALHSPSSPASSHGSRARRRSSSTSALLGLWTGRRWRGHRPYKCWTLAKALNK